MENVSIIQSVIQMVLTVGTVVFAVYKSMISSAGRFQEIEKTMNEQSRLINKYSDQQGKINDLVVRIDERMKAFQTAIDDIKKNIETLRNT